MAAAARIWRISVSLLMMRIRWVSRKASSVRHRKIKVKSMERPNPLRHSSVDLRQLLTALAAWIFISDRPFSIISKRIFSAHLAYLLFALDDPDKMGQP